MEVILHFSFLLLLHFIVLANTLNDEGLALLSFKQALDNTSVSYLGNWNSYDSTPCSWNGVQCREGKVTSIILPGKGLRGALHLDGGKLPAIQLVDLRNNRFSGSIPVELLNATGLKSLVLAANSLSGLIPGDMGNLMYLQSLDLSTNSFNGSLPSSLVHCKRLKKLVLGGNSFSGSLPDRFGTTLSMLQMLNLSYNNFSGLIPADIGKLSNLQGVLDLSHNLFDGPIPESLGDLPESVYINLADNNLSGAIPQNGALSNAGPTAFLENPLLCGPPLKIMCPLYPKPIAGKPSETSGGSKKGKGHHWTPWIIVVTASGMVIGMSLLCLLFSYRFRKCHPSRKQAKVEGCTLEQRSSIRKERFCFRTDDLESLTENIDQYTFIPLDQHVSFNLEQLLKASAFLLGKSIRGLVYKVVLEKGPTVAVRRLENAGSSRFKEFQTAVEAIGKIRHPNIVGLLAYCWCVNERILVYEYIPNGDLATALHGDNTGAYLKPLPWTARLRIIKGVAKGLAHLHEFSQRKFVHGNLKPSNILLGNDMEPHISDAGLSRLAHTVQEFQACQSEKSVRSTPEQGTSSMSGSCYEAPETSKTAKPSQKWDVYSFGVILLELISGKSPGMQKGSSQMNLVRWIQLGIEIKELADIIDPFLSRDLVQDEMLAAVKIALACVHSKPDKRPSMRNVCDNLDRLAKST